VALPQSCKTVPVPEHRRHHGPDVVLIGQHAERSELGIGGCWARAGQHFRHLLEDGRQLRPEILQDFEERVVHIELKVLLHIGPVYRPQHGDSLDGLECVPDMTLCRLGEQRECLLLKLDAFFPADVGQPTRDCRRSYRTHNEDGSTAG